ncbi:MAG TPA: GrpB family protein [Gemmatimonadaceae bacterium]
MKIVLAEYDPAWTHAFSREAERIRPVFGALLVELHHIGSPAVPGLRAKPVIDMLAVVSDVRALDKQTKGFEALGYEAMGEFGLLGRRYFRRDDPAGVRTHQVHAYAVESSGEIERHLNFRDYIRQHPDVARAYSDLKQALVGRVPQRHALLQ